MDNTYNTQNVLSLCPGILGLERGIERGIRTYARNGNISLGRNEAIKVVAYVEIEAFIIANLVGQMETGLLDSAPIWTDVKTFDALPFRNKVHGIIGGYPCQPFSHAGERKGVDDERHLYPYISKQIEIIRPDWVYFENVGGHLSMGYEEVRRDLSNLGYRIEEGIFTAEEVGAPHRRERLFIFGTLENADIIRWGGRVVRSNEEGSKAENKIERSGTHVEYATNERFQKPRFSGLGESQQEDGSRMDNRFKQPSSELANPNCDDSGTNNGYVQSEKAEGISEAYKRERDRDELGSFDSIMDNTINEGFQRYPRNDSAAERWERQERSTSKTSLFPYGQGEYQQEWEEPRTIESGMVYTIDGYNFTEDLHRAIGNSVVEQTAELAFVTLLEKHIKNGNSKVD